MNITQPQRAYIYRVALAVLAVLLGYGVLADGDVANLTLLIGAILGLPVAGLAAAHTPTE
ncbi:hypothetical protein GS504_15580 [Rhodococcus hoagii]|nr:hypothetical protein [Prescottella equi]NKR94337.1 hypothetical protein [Prescottella equi]NKS56092.1 hypothetical protein [Prescottella equi]NKS58879.1 hypothetical protein [Prescottella equi]NKS69092.1 hypothetical protein [Prescottella equi]